MDMINSEVGMEINISKQIIDQRINVIMKENPDYFAGDDETRRKSKFFLLLGVASYLDIDISEAVTYITDGGNDGGFDAAYIDTTQDGQMNVVLFQSKYKRDLDNESNFPANAIEKAVNTVKTVFDPSMTTDLNENGQKIVDEIRSLILDGYIPYVTFVMVNNGLKWTKEGQNYIDNAFGQQEFVKFEHYGYSEILGYIERIQPINTQMHLSGAAIQENFNYKRVIIGKLNVSEIKKLMDENGDKLLERNIRKYLGRNSINEEISQTLKNDKRANFFFYNNGITMICKKFSFNALQEKNWIVKTEGLQIINGGQTCRTIWQTLNESDASSTDDVYVLVRIYELNEDDDEDIVNTITYATNHQNPVDLRDLKSNSVQQINLRTAAIDLGYVYKPKRDNENTTGSIPATVAAEAVLAIWRQCPHLAKYKKTELFGLYYDRIFTNLNAAQMIIAVMIFRYCDANRKKNTEIPAIRTIRSYSNYFLACVIGQRLLRENNLKLEQLSHKNFTEVKDHLEKNKESLIVWAENKMVDILRDYFSLSEGDSLEDIDGRTMAAAFRRFDIVEKYFKDENWWKKALSDTNP